MLRSGDISLVVNPAKFRGAVQNAVKRGLSAGAGVLVAYIKDSFARTGGPPSKAGTPPAVQTGTLRRAIAMTRPDNGIVYVHTSGVKYAYTQEYGGPIKATARQYLAIPIGKAGKQIRKEAEGTLYNSPRDLFVLKSKRGNLLLMERHGKRKKVTPRFILKRSVVLPERPFMRPALANRRVQMKIVGEFVLKSMREFNRLVEA